MPTRRLLTHLALLCSALAAVASPAAAASTKVAAPGTSLLFVQQTSRGTLVHVRGSSYQLRLRGVSPHLTTFTDRPHRQAGQVSSAAFISHWAAYGFRADPPNAALVVDGAPSSSDVVLLELSRPRYERATQTMTYAVRQLRRAGTSSELTGFAGRADPIRPRSFGSASLFIDDAATNRYYPIVSISAQNVTATTTTMSFQLRGGTIAAGAGGVQMAGISSLAPQIISLRASALTFLVPSGASGTFTLNLPVANAYSGYPPTIMATNFTGTMIVTWPTDVGPQSQVLVPYAPLTLSGMV